jgi:hypothetical protein
MQPPFRFGVNMRTVDEMVECLRQRRVRWGLSYYVIFEPVMEAFAPVVARLTGT